jgi:hypothetical protein
MQRRGQVLPHLHLEVPAAMLLRGHPPPMVVHQELQVVQDLQVTEEEENPRSLQTAPTLLLPPPPAYPQAAQPSGS